MNLEMKRKMNKEMDMEKKDKEFKFPEIDYKATEERIRRLCREKGIREADIISYAQHIDVCDNIYRWRRDLQREFLTTEGLFVISQLTQVPISELLVLKYPE